MSSNQTVYIQLRPYLKDYFVKKLGPEPIKATSKNKLFILLLPYLTKVPKNYNPSNFKDNKFLLLELPFNELVNVRCYNYIDPKNYGEIQSYFYGIFYHDFTRTVNKYHIDQGMNIKNSIILFCEENDVNFDYTNYDSLKRIYLRYRKRLKKVNQKLGEKVA